MNTNKQRLSYLDGVRAIGLILIVIFHCFGTFGGPWQHVTIINQAVRFLWVGVDVFFVLSGFLITGILLKSKKNGDGLKVFYFHRFLRIFPAYYAYLIFAAILMASPARWFVGPPIPVTDWLWPIFHLQNLEVIMRGKEMIPEVFIHLWSLAIEQHFYLLWPLIVMVMRPKSLLSLCGFVIFITPMIRLVTWHNFGVITYFQTFCRWDSLLIGAAIALLVNEDVLREKPHNSLPRLGAVVGGLSFIAVLALVVLGKTTNHLSFGFQTIGYSFVALAFGGWMLWLVTTPGGAIPKRFLSTTPLLHIAKYSYAMYLFHHPLCYIIKHVLEKIGVSGWAGWPLLFVCVFALSYLIAALSWRFIEQPCLLLKSRIKAS